MTKHRTIILPELLFSYCKFRIEDDFIDKVHAPLEIAISEVVKELALVSPEDEGSGWADAVIDDGCSLIEDLLGTSFVVLQTYITAVRSAIIDLSQVCEKKFGSPLSFYSGPVSLLKFNGENLYSEPSAVEIINAIANYWKHRDEWGPDWDELDERSKKTAKLIQVAGLSCGSTGNLRNAAKYFGVNDLYNLKPIRYKVRSWGQLLLKMSEAEIERSKVQ